MLALAPCNNSSLPCVTRTANGTTALEQGFEKVALYGTALEYSHAARQLPSGKWSSKLGKDVDIEHDTPNDVAGGVYGEVMQIMKRPVSGTV